MIGAYVLDAATRRIIPHSAPVVVLATGRLREGLPLHLESRHRDRRRPRHGLPRRVPRWRTSSSCSSTRPASTIPGAKNFLISEAVRGEGGILRTISGERFMDAHPMEELAPRDVVARAIDREMKRRGDHYVLLHIEHLDPDRVRAPLPRDPRDLPAVRDRHHAPPDSRSCRRRTTCAAAWRSTAGDGPTWPGLYAVGEVACTGLHGANRLASNSLLEAACFGARAAQDAVERRRGTPPPAPAPEWEVGHASLPKESVLIDAHWDLVRRLMWDFVGIVRTDHRLELASRYLEILRRSIESYYWDFVLDADLVELRNVALVAELIVRSARMRPESRGLHYNEDHPDEDPARARDTVLQLDEPLEV